MNWEDIKAKKRKWITILLVIFLLPVLLFFLIILYTSFFPCSWLFPCPGPPMRPVQFTNSWYDDYLLEENLNTFELPYSNANLCQTNIIVNTIPDAFKEEDKITVFIHSINLDGSELLSEPAILPYQYLSGLDIWSLEPLSLNHELRKNEGVLKVTMSATESINVTIKMNQYEEFCKI